MHQEVAVIHEDPVGRFVTFGGDRFVAEFGELFADSVADGVVLAGVGAGTNEEIIRKARYAFEVEDFDVEGFLGFGRAVGGNDFRGKVW